MQSASAAHVLAQSELLVGAAFGSKSLWPIVMKRPSSGPSALWPQSKVPSAHVRQLPKFSSKMVEAGGGDGDIDGGGGDGGDGGGVGNTDGGGEGAGGGGDGDADGGAGRRMKHR